MDNPQEFLSRPKTKEVVKVSIAHVLHFNESFVHINRLTLYAPAAVLVSQRRLFRARQDGAPDAEAETGDISVEYTIEGPNLQVIQESIDSDDFGHDLAVEMDVELEERHLPLSHPNVLATSASMSAAIAEDPEDNNSDDPDGSTNAEDPEDNNSDDPDGSNLGAIVGAGLVGVLVLGGVVFLSGACSQENHDEAHGLEMASYDADSRV